MAQPFRSVLQTGLSHWWRPKSLRVRLMNMLALFALSLFLLSVSGIVYFVHRIEAAAWRGRQTEAALAAAQAVSNFLDNSENALLLLSRLDPDYLADNPTIMLEMIALQPEILEIVLLDADGVVIVSAAQEAPLLANLFTIPLSQWFQRARIGDRFYGSLQISAADEPYLILAVPAAGGGVIAARLNMAILWQVVGDIRFGETGQAYVINQDGWIIAHTEPAVVMEQTNIIGHAIFENLRRSRDSEWSGSYTNFQGSSVVGVTVPVTLANWILIAEISNREAHAASRNALTILGGAILFFTALVVVTSRSFLLESVLKPLEQLRAGAERLGEGNLDYRVDLDHDNEIGQVARAFDDMAERLYENARALDAQAVSLAAEIAERRITEQALRQSEARYRAIVEDQTELICRFQLNAALTFVNEAYCQYFGRSYDELIGQSFLTFVPEEDRAFIKTQLGLLNISNPVISFERPAVSNNGDAGYMQWTNRAIFDEADNLIEFQAVGRDVTSQKIAEAEIQRLTADLERRVKLRTLELAQAVKKLRTEVAERQRAEEELFESRQRLQLALNAAKAGAWGWNMHTNQAVWSDGNYLVMGLEPGSVEPHYDNWLACVHPDDRERASEQVAEAMQSFSTLDIEFRVVWPDGSVHWLNDIGQMRFDDKGQPEGMYGIQMDITERKRIEKQIKDSLYEKEVLLKEIHHRVKNNLQVIASMLNLQSTQLDDPHAQEIFRASQNRVAAMAIIHEKLYQSKNLAWIDFGDYIRELTSQLLSSYEGLGQFIQLEVYADDIWLSVNTAVPCGLILNELVANAYKHAFPSAQASGCVMVRFERMPHEQLRLSVTDNGVGVPADIDLQRTSSLGLTLVSALTRQISGRLEVETGRETVFSLIFPAPSEGILNQ